MSHETSVLSRVGAGITRLRNFVINAVFLIVLLLLVVSALSTCATFTVPSGSALLLNPIGTIVDTRSYPSDWQSLLASDAQGETELGELLLAIRSAAEDEAIEAILLDLSDLQGLSPVHANRIGRALQSAKDAGKRVISYADFYSQSQYHLASYADAVYMHPGGQILLPGYGGFGFYYRELLDKLNVTVHVFRVGEFKSAIEPLTRNGMSEESRMDTEALYSDLWQHFVSTIATNRDIAEHDVERYANEIASIVKASKGDLARAALEHHLIDELLTRDEVRARIGEQVGFGGEYGEALNAIDFATYLGARGLPGTDQDAPRIGVITAQGPIVLEGPYGTTAAAETLIELIRRARLDDGIAALVLRVDSPGGSQLASELIRQEIELVQLVGKPVVASFGSAAASGGYWIAATADEIVAEATTITGSIGIFSAITTYENSLKSIGVHADGVGTTDNTLGLSLFGGINPQMGEVLQARVESGYEQFLSLVAKGRGRSLDDIRQVAEGRVWSGEAALEVGLVDQIGGLQTALERAAALAGLERYAPAALKPALDPRSQILAELISQGASLGIATPSARRDPLRVAFDRALRELTVFSDPTHVYALCLPCWR